MLWNLQSLLPEVPAQGVHRRTFSLVLLSQEGAVAASAGVVVVVPTEWMQCGPARSNAQSSGEPCFCLPIR